MAVSFLVLAGGAGYFLGQREISIQKTQSLPQISIRRVVPSDKQSKVDFNLFWQVWDELESKYLGRKDLNYGQMVNGAISGMVASLGDPYTVFLPPEENKETKDDLRGDFEGVGIQIAYNKEGRVSVVAPLSGTPADKAGLLAGDVIVKIVDDRKKIDKETIGMTLPEAVGLIRGPKGSVVKLTIKRGETEPFEVDLKRETIVVKSVEVDFEEESGKRFAVLKLSRFGERTYQEWEEAVEAIAKEKTKGNFAGIILDLRNNPGGYLQGSVFIGSEFLSKGVVVQQDKGVNGKETYSVNRRGELLNDPLVVLINNGSASASEIVAGALQEAKRAKLVGEKTFGKGTIQEAEDLPGEAGLHITVARWLLPSGKSIDKEGVSPDFEVKIEEPKNASSEAVLKEDLQLKKAIQVLLLR